MKPEFSELSFAFAYTAELAKKTSGALTVAPSFPSTAKEGKTGYGYDLKLGYGGIPLFLQFKLSHCMRRKDAAEFTSGKFIQGSPINPVYRFYLMALGKSRQTSLMLKLEKKHGLVFYVAPGFYKTKELNTHFFAATVEKNSRPIRPSKIKKMPDKKEHFVSFRLSGPCHRFSENPELVEDEPDSILGAIESTDSKPVEAGHVLESLLHILRDERVLSIPRLPFSGSQAEYSDAVTAQYVSRTFFGCELLFLQHETG